MLPVLGEEHYRPVAIVGCRRRNGVGAAVVIAAIATMVGPRRVCDRGRDGDGFPVGAMVFTTMPQGDGGAVRQQCRRTGLIRMVATRPVSGDWAIVGYCDGYGIRPLAGPTSSG